MNPYFLADQVRSIDLIRVLKQLHCQPDPADRKKWKTPKGSISVTGQKFINWGSGSGGGGAIDLVMHILDYSFSQAVFWLSDAFAFQPVASTAIQLKPKRPATADFCLPKPVNANWDRVRNYLVQTRNLPESIVQDLFLNQSVFADCRANAVFVMKDVGGNPKGAELRGTGAAPFKGLAKGSCKKSAFFACGHSKRKLLALCESAIDAISFSVLFPNMVAVSTAGTNESPDWIDLLIKRNWTVFCAFDSDPAGESMTRSLLGEFNHIGIIRPPRKDWNLCI